MEASLNTQPSPKIVEMINTILHDKFEIPRDQLVPSAHIKDDLKLDSLDFVDMFILLEQQTGKGAENVDFMKIRTLGDIYAMVDELSRESAAH
jgi:acyl carrier protein